MLTPPVDLFCEPLSDACSHIRMRAEHVVVGVSPGNSYFSEENLTNLLHWAGREFRRVAVMIPDSALVETLLAAGYTPARAATKARETALRLRNRVVRAWQATGNAARDTGDRFGLYMLSELASRAAYQSLLRSAQEWLAEDSELRESCLRLSRLVLSSYLHGGEPTPAQIEKALGYLVAELPLLMDSPAIFGVESSTAIYHQRVEYIETIYLKRRTLRMSRNQGFAIVSPAPFAAARAHADAVALSSEA